MALSPAPAATSLLLLVGLAVMIGCATTHLPSDGEARPASNVPDHFLAGTHGDTTTTEPMQGEGCRNPMVDPRTGTRVRLVRSKEDRGDYEVPDGRYGVGEQDLLRLECGTGRVVGVVRR